MHHICAWCLQRPGKGNGSPSPWELELEMVVSWELNLGILDEQ